MPEYRSWESFILKRHADKYGPIPDNLIGSKDREYTRKKLRHLKNVCESLYIDLDVFKKTTSSQMYCITSQVAELFTFLLDRMVLEKNNRYRGVKPLSEKNMIYLRKLLLEALMSCKIPKNIIVRELKIYDKRNGYPPKRENNCQPLPSLLPPVPSQTLSLPELKLTEISFGRTPEYTGDISSMYDARFSSIGSYPTLWWTDNDSFDTYNVLSYTAIKPDEE